ncbi:ABC transporter transmembrane domain-containing protein [Lactobacillus mulieris]|uniref:ABC transporter transmembrane domain-containing protein n=1 Tax=Lactobacillus mulieris TaxID=2508708 RepID=UPI001CD388CC
MSFLKLLKINLIRAITLILATVLGAVLVAVGNSYLTNIGNSLQKQDINTFLRYMLLFFVVLVGGESIEFIASYLFAKQVQEYLHEVRERITRKLFLQKETTKITDVQNSLTNDLNMMNDNFLTPLYKIISSIFNIVFSIAIVFTYSWILVVLILILAVVMFVLPQLISKPLEKATVAVSENIP